MTITTLEKFQRLENELSGSLVERDEVIHGAVLALAGKLHMFMVGTPGVAKSMVVDQLALRLDFDQEDYFKWLLGKYTTPEELFGPPSFSEMKNNDRYKRVTDRKLPQARIGFLDEIFKANSAILNSLLTILNEGEFQNHEDDPSVPLTTLFSASNEIPVSGGDLAALADRLHLWYDVSEIKEAGNFVKMLKMEEPVAPERFLSKEDLDNASKEIAKVEIPEDLFGVFVELREALATNGIKVSDRRFRNSLSLVRSEAWLNGRDVAAVEDLTPLQHMLWRNQEDIQTVRTEVLNLVDPLERDILEATTDLNLMFATFQADIADADSKMARTRLAVEAHEKAQSADDATKDFFGQFKEADREPSKSLIVLKDRVSEVFDNILAEAKILSNRDS